MTAYFALTTTGGCLAVVPVPAGQDRWLIAVRYVNAYCSRDDFLADVRLARPEEITALRAKHPRMYLDWLARDS